MSRIRIGIRLDPAHPRGGPEAVGEAVATLMRAAVLSEELGLDVVWVAERPTQARALVPAALPVCAAMLAATTRLRVATGLLPLPLHQPLRVAEDAATLDGMSAGRFELGVGLGSDPEGLARYGFAVEERVERFLEALDLLRHAWKPGPIPSAGRHQRVPAIEVTPKPGDPDGPPLWIGTREAALQRRAAALGAGLLLAPAASPEPYVQAVGNGALRLGWLLSPPAEAERALDESLGVLARSRSASCVDLVFRMPRSAGDSELRSLLELLGRELAPRLRRTRSA